MDTTTRAASPLRQRMLEDMRTRKLEPRTQEGYIRAVRKLTVYLKRSPDTATVEDLRNFQLHLVDTGTSPITLNATLTGLRFFFDITLGRGELMARMQPVKLPRTVPVVLSMQEAAALIAAARNIKHQAALSVAYGAGLRAREVCRLKVGDVDSELMALRVEQGKGAKDRYAMLSHRVAISNSRLLALDERGVSFGWKDYRAKGKTRYKAMTLSPEEFMRRFLLHVLPSGFHRIRHYGLLANGSRKSNLAAARQFLAVPVDITPGNDSASAANDEFAAKPPIFVCRHCGRDPSRSRSRWCADRTLGRQQHREANTLQSESSG